MNPKTPGVTEQQARRNRILLIVMALIPMVVIGLAQFAYVTGIGLPDQTRNKGTLINPPQQLLSISPTLENGEAFDVETPLKQWTFLVVGRGQCDDVCVERLWNVRQTHRTLGKYQRNVRRVYINLDTSMSEDMRDFLAAEHPNMSVIHADALRFEQLMTAVETPVDVFNPYLFYLMDPRGFVMMYYGSENFREEAVYKDVIKDMKILLKGVE